MKKQAIQKINKIGVIGNRFVKIIRVAFTLLMLIVSIMLFMNPEQYVNLEINGGTFSLTEISGVSDVTFSSVRLMIFIILTIIELILALIVIYRFEMLCNALGKCESPFEENVVQKMNIFSTMLIVFIIYGCLYEIFASAVLVGFSSLQFNVSLTEIAIVVVIKLLVYIFKYGAVLQQESDETL